MPYRQFMQQSAGMGMANVYGNFLAPIPAQSLTAKEPESPDKKLLLIIEEESSDEIEAL